MKQSARIQTTITIWEHLMGSNLPMDKFCGDFFRGNRFIGSKDRRDLAGRLYGMMRHYARLQWWVKRLGLPEDSGRSWTLTYLAFDKEYGTAQIEDLFCGEKYAPDTLNEAEQKALKTLAEYGGDINHPEMPEDVSLECPQWAYEGLRNLFGEDGEKLKAEMNAMLEPATLHIRVNTIKRQRNEVVESLKADNVDAEEGKICPNALRLPPHVYLSQTKSFKKGWIEIQDEGSQAIALLCDVRPGMQVLDYCAGGGGKTLALADMMQGKGRIIAMDSDARRLERGRKRYIKAGIHNVEIRPLGEEKHRKWIRRQKGKFDCVLVDAPCSGTGTWRRNPDLRWRNAGPSFEELQSIQAEILDRVAQYVKPGGALVYGTCSMLPQENEDQIAKFLQAHPDFEIDPVTNILPDIGGMSDRFLSLTPAQNGTDGFFAARLVKRAEQENAISA